MDVAGWIRRHVAALRQQGTWKGAVSVTAPAHRESGHVIDIDGEHVVAQFIVWPAGTMEATVGAVVSGQLVYEDAAQSLDESQLEERWQRFLSALRQVEKST